MKYFNEKIKGNCWYGPDILAGVCECEPLESFNELKTKIMSSAKKKIL